MEAVDDLDRLDALLVGAHRDRRAVGVAARDHQHVVAPAAVVAGEDVGRQVGAGDVAEVLRSVRVRPGHGHEDRTWATLSVGERWPSPEVTREAASLRPGVSSGGLLAVGDLRGRGLGLGDGLLGRRRRPLAHLLDQLLRLLAVLGGVELLRLRDQLLALGTRRVLLELLEGEGHGRHSYPAEVTSWTSRCPVRRRSAAGRGAGLARRAPAAERPPAGRGRLRGTALAAAVGARRRSDPPARSSTTSCAGPGCAGRRTRSASAGPGPTILHAGTRGAAGALPVRPAVGRGDLVPAVQRARRRQRPGGNLTHAGRARRRRVGRERPEDLDVARPARPLRHPHRPHRPGARPSSRASRTSSARWTRRASRSARSSR